MEKNARMTIKPRTNSVLYADNCSGVAWGSSSAINLGAKGIRITEAARMRQVKTIKTYLTRMKVVDLEGNLSPKLLYEFARKELRLCFRFMLDFGWRSKKKRQYLRRYSWIKIERNKKSDQEIQLFFQEVVQVVKWDWEQTVQCELNDTKTRLQEHWIPYTRQPNQHKKQQIYKKKRQQVMKSNRMQSLFRRRMRGRRQC